MDNLENIKRLISTIRDQSRLEKTEDGLLKFSPEDSEMLMKSVINMPGDHQKEKLRIAIKEVFDLDNKDIVIFRQNSIFIKKWGGTPILYHEIVDKIRDAISRENSKENGSSEIPIISDCISISTEGLFEELGISASDLTAESKEKIKQKLKEQIMLSDKDVILFLNDKVVIRRFKLQEGDERKREQRYNGLPKEELAILKNSIFESQEMEQEIVSDITSQLLETELDFARITHVYFTKNYIKIFQKAIFSFLKENLSEEDIVLEGLANLILRENWILIHTKMAIAILDLVAKKNQNAENFLKNYSGEIEIDSERNKYQLPEILDRNGNKWNIPSIVGIVMQRKKLLDSLSLKQKAIDDLRTHIEGLYAKIDELNEEEINIKKEIESIGYESKEKASIEAATNAEIKELREMLKRCKDEDAKKIQGEIGNKILFLKKLIIQEDGYFTKQKRLELQQKNIAGKIEKINFDINKLQKKLREEEEKNAQFISSQKGLDEKFELLSEALTLALMKRKVKL